MFYSPSSQGAGALNFLYPPKPIRSLPPNCKLSLVCFFLPPPPPPELYNRGLIYLDIPIADLDFIVVPPLQGFVMNRVQGDYFETLLYKIFVSIDEHTNMSDLASVLQVDLNQVKVCSVLLIRSRCVSLVSY